MTDREMLVDVCLHLGSGLCAPWGCEPEPMTPKNMQWLLDRIAKHIADNPLP